MRLCLVKCMFVIPQYLYIIIQCLVVNRMIPYVYFNFLPSDIVRYSLIYLLPTIYIQHPTFSIVFVSYINSESPKYKDSGK